MIYAAFALVDRIEIAELTRSFFRSRRQSASSSGMKLGCGNGIARCADRRPAWQAVWSVIGAGAVDMGAGAIGMADVCEPTSTAGSRERTLPVVQADNCGDNVQESTT